MSTLLYFRFLCRAQHQPIMSRCRFWFTIWFGILDVPRKLYWYSCRDFCRGGQRWCMIVNIEYLMKLTGSRRAGSITMVLAWIFLLFFSMVPFLDHFWTIFGACSALCKQRRINLITPFSLDVDLWRHVEHLLLRRAELRQFRFPLHVHKHFENLSCILLALRSLTHLPGTWDPISLTPIPE